MIKLSSLVEYCQGLANVGIDRICQTITSRKPPEVVDRNGLASSGFVHKRCHRGVMYTGHAANTDPVRPAVVPALTIGSAAPGYLAYVVYTVLFLAVQQPGHFLKLARTQSPTG